MKFKLVYIFSFLFVSLSLMAQENIFLKADSLYADGVEAYNTNNLANAIKSFISCDSINKVYNRPMPYFSSNAPQWASRCLYLFGDEDAAKSLGDDFRLEPVDQRLTIESDSLGWLASECLNNQDYEGMYQYALKAKPIEERILGKDHYYCLNTNYIIGLHSLVNGDAKSMIPYMEQYASVMSGLDKHYPMLIEIYRQLVDAYDTENLIDKGVSLHHYLREEYIDDDTIWPKLAEKLSGLTYNIADTLKSQNKIDEAIEYAKLSLEYSAFDNGGYNTNRWLALSLLSDIYERIAPSKSIEYTTERIKVSKYIDSNGKYITDLWSLAILYEINGDVNQSQKVKDSIWDACLHNDSASMQELYGCLSSMAVTYRDINNYDKALSLGLLIVDLRRKNGDTKDSYYISDLRMLAYYYFCKADYANAFTTIKLALKEAKTILTKQNYQYSLILSDYAKIQEVLTGNHHRAVKKEKEALALMESLPTYDKTAHISILEHIAGSYGFKNELDSSIVYYNKAYEERFCFDDVTGHDIGNLFNLMATCFSKVSHSDKIDPEIVGKIKYYEEKWFPLYKDEIIKYCNSLNRSQRSLYWGNSNSVFSIFPLLVSALYSDSITNSITYDAILLSKGLLLETEKELESIIIRSDNLELLDKYNKWKKCDSSQEKEAMEIEIINKCKEFGNITQRLTTTWQDIQKNLSSNDVAIEFKDCGLDETSLVIASVIKKEFDSPKTVIVGDNEYDYANVWVEILDSMRLCQK